MFPDTFILAFGTEQEQPKELRHKTPFMKGLFLKVPPIPFRISQISESGSKLQMLFSWWHVLGRHSSSIIIAGGKSTFSGYCQWTTNLRISPTNRLAIAVSPVAQPINL